MTDRLRDRMSQTAKQFAELDMTGQISAWKRSIRRAINNDPKTFPWMISDAARAIVFNPHIVEDVCELLDYCGSQSNKNGAWFFTAFGHVCDTHQIQWRQRPGRKAK